MSTSRQRKQVKTVVLLESTYVCFVNSDSSREASDVILYGIRDRKGEESCRKDMLRVALSLTRMF